MNKLYLKSKNEGKPKEIINYITVSKFLFKNVATGMVIGMCLGMAIGSGIKKEKEKKG